MMDLQKRYSIAPEVLKAISKDNERLSKDLILVLAVIAAAFVAFNIFISTVRHARMLLCLTNETQRYFREPQCIFAWLKQHMIYAPLLTRRHSNQVKIGRIELGTLPTRFQSIFFAGIIVMNIILALYGMGWNGVESTLVMHLRNRLGSLAIMNMIPLVLIAGRNNPLIALTRMPFDTFNLAHRWLGHVVIALAFAHGVCELHYFDILAKRMHMPTPKAINEFMTEAPSFFWGLTAWTAMLAIFLTTFTAFRHAFYETFLHTHILLVALTLGALWYHLKALPPFISLKIIIAIWVVERVLRLLKLTYRNLGRQTTQATIESLPGSTMRVTLRLARPFAFKPGQHIYLILPTIGLWTSHPFAVAWSETLPASPYDPEKGPDSLASSNLAYPLHNSYHAHHSQRPQKTVSLLIRAVSLFSSPPLASSRVFHKRLSNPSRALPPISQQISQAKKTDRQLPSTIASHTTFQNC